MSSPSGLSKVDSAVPTGDVPEIGKPGRAHDIKEEDPLEGLDIADIVDGPRARKEVALNQSDEAGMLPDDDEDDDYHPPEEEEEEEEDKDEDDEGEEDEDEDIEARDDDAMEH